MPIGDGNELSVEDNLVQLLFKIDLYLANTQTSIQFSKIKYTSPGKKQTNKQKQFLATLSSRQNN